MSKNIKISHVGVNSIGRLVGTVHAIIAVVAGTIGSIATIAAVVTSHDYGFWNSIAISAGIFVGGIVLVPLVAFGLGWLYGALVGVIWNLVLGASGGLDVTIEETTAKN